MPPDKIGHDVGDGINRKLRLKALNKLIISGIVICALGLGTTLLMAKPESAQIISIDSPPAVKIDRNLEVEATESLMPKRFYVRMQRGENLISMFERLKLESADLAKMMNNVPRAERRSLSRLPRGTQILVSLEDDESLKEIVVMDDAIRGTRYYWDGTDLLNQAAQVGVEDYTAEYDVKYKYSGGIIENSLYQDGINNGLSGRLILNFAEVFAYDIDFANDVWAGDSFSMLLEDTYVEDRLVSESRISVAEFINRGKSVMAIRYTNSKGETGYFTPEGESMQSRFLRMPIKLARITSRFNPRRLHPVLKVVRPHNGVDFGARPGTPVFTTGNGRVEFVGWKSGYGNTVIVNHGDGYSTLYAHLRGFARGMRRGTRVKQGEIIAYVGNTGISTGPHLHYEFRINGKHRDPLRVNFARSLKLDKNELPNFLAHSEELLAHYHQLREGGDSTELVANN